MQTISICIQLGPIMPGCCLTMAKLLIGRFQLKNVWWFHNNRFHWHSWNSVRRQNKVLQRFSTRPLQPIRTSVILPLQRVFNNTAYYLVPIYVFRIANTQTAETVTWKSRTLQTVVACYIKVLTVDTLQIYCENTPMDCKLNNWYLRSKLTFRISKLAGIIHSLTPLRIIRAVRDKREWN